MSSQPNPIDWPTESARQPAGTPWVVPLKQPACRILILGGDSDFNLGDHAILYALCDSLSAQIPRARITITSNRHAPGDMPGVTEVIPRGPRSLPALITTTGKQDLVIVGGGGLFQDDDSRIKMPYWGTRIRLLARKNPRIVAHSLGAGPLRNPESRWFARLACENLQHVSVRDGFARDCLAACTDRPIDIAPDPAFMLRPAPLEAADTCLQHNGITPGEPVIGVALRGWFHRRGGFLPQKLRARVALDRNHGKRDMHACLQQISRALSALSEELGARVLLMPSYDAPQEADVRVCRQLAAMMPHRVTSLALIHDPRLYKAVCGRLTLMISARMHPLILAAGMGVPGVGLGYNGKFGGFFDMLGGTERLIGLDAFRDGDQVDQLLSLTRAALDDGAALQECSRRITHHAQQSVAELLVRWLTTSGAAP